MKKKILACPYYIWAIIFVIVPVFIVGFYALTNESGEFAIENLGAIFGSTKVLLRSIEYALLSTAICLLLGYPLAYIISKQSQKAKSIYMILLLLPMWMNFILRIQAIKNLLLDNGFINQLIKMLGGNEITMFATPFAVILGMVYNYLPFMVLPIYTVLDKMDNSVIEAARDLGAGTINVFKRVILPLSMPGVVSGVIMVFVPGVSTYVISEKLGGGKYDLIGDVIARQFLGESANMHIGSAISLILLVFILISLVVFNFLDDETKEGVVI